MNMAESPDHYTAMNRAAWNEIATVRQQDMFPGPEFFAGGGTILDAEPIEALGDVGGLRLLQLQCATGEETLSWANLGARATGVDIADQQVALARAKAAAAGLDVRFVAADVLALPPELQQADFDIVYTGTGVMVWLPDLTLWARSIAAALRPGGRFLLWEEHPLAMCLTMENDQMVVVSDYFGRGQADILQGWTHFSGGEQATSLQAQFSWPLGDIVTALAQAGLQIEVLREEPARANFRFTSEKVPPIPGWFLLLARKG
jgi:SAM-dependent methyltransferase